MLSIPQVVLSLSICFISFISLGFSGMSIFLLGFYFVLNDLVYFVE
jgi:hypothetical protein